MTKKATPESSVVPTKSDRAPVPFSNDEGVIAGLTLSNRADQIAGWGQLAIRKDQAGLAQARALADFFAQAVAVLEAEKELPATLETLAPVMKANPFN